jgi:general secretion pathway protein B
MGAQAPAVARQAAVTPAPSADETLRTANELPEQIRFSVPKVAFGGYMYSPNPADRLVLVDKALRHEGEEVAPGLVLEKLLPKAAVMNYRGYRYRVPL